MRGQSEEAARSGGLRGHIEEAIRAGGGVKEQADVTGRRGVGLSRGGEGTVLAQPAMATLTPPPPPLPPRDSCPPPLASTRGQTPASTFPSLPSTAPPPTLQRPSQMKASQPFVEEKSSVIGELKNMLVDGGSNGGTLGRTQGSSGFKLPVPQEPMDTSNPQDPTVKRIVYNQYREMLKSYRTAQT